MPTLTMWAAWDRESTPQRGRREAQFRPFRHTSEERPSKVLEVITALPSAGFYALLAWSAYTGTWTQALVVFVVYGVARAVPGVIIALFSRGGSRSPKLVHEFTNLIGCLRAVEVAFLISIGAMSISALRLS